MSLFCCLKNKATRQNPPESRKNCRSYQREIGTHIFQATGILQALNRKGILQCSPKNCLAGLLKCLLLQGIRFLIPSSVAVRLQWLPVIWGGIQSVMKLTRILFQPSEKSCKSNKTIFMEQNTYFQKTISKPT